MRIAFAIVSLFPGGGLQRDCVEIAKLVRGLGHEVTIYTCRLHDHTLADDIPILLLQNEVATNHGRQYAFAVDFLKQASDHYDLIVGFDKLFGLDVLYCADPSMAYRLLKQPYLYLLSRYRTYNALEKDSFAPNNKTKIILLSHGQMSEYWSVWGTEAGRMNLVPPTLTLDRRRPDCRTNGVRQTLRSQLGLTNDDLVWVSICVQPYTKGIDRVIRALAKFPDVKLVIAGLTETTRSCGKSPCATFSLVSLCCVGCPSTLVLVCVVILDLSSPAGIRIAVTWTLCPIFVLRSTLSPGTSTYFVVVVVVVSGSPDAPTVVCVFVSLTGTALSSMYVVVDSPVCRQPA